MQKLFFLAVCIGVSAASVDPKGMVTPVTRCGGVGAFLQLRVTDCEGTCHLYPGKEYVMEADLIPANAFNTAQLLIEANVFGQEIVILNTEIGYPGAGGGGQMITITYSLTPNDILSGNAVRITTNLTNNFSGNLELCFQNTVVIL